MAALKDAREAEEQVRTYYKRDPFGPQPHSFVTHKQGDIWIVRFTLGATVTKDSKECEWHIKAKDGRVTKK